MIDVSANPITNMAITFALIIVGIIIIAVAFSMLLNIIRAPQWLVKPIVTAGVLIGMYIMFHVFT